MFQVELVIMPRDLVGNIPGSALPLRCALRGYRGILKSEISGVPVPDRTDTKGEAMKARIVYYSMTIAGMKGERSPSENEFAAARFQGKHVASLAARLVR
jgi:hypothetical protein